MVLLRIKGPETEEEDSLSGSLDELIDRLYDDTPEAGDNGLYGLELNEGLTFKEEAAAARYALLSRGVMVIHGQPGCGKGLAGIYLAWKFRRMFKDHKVILDYRPRRLFDYSTPGNRIHIWDSNFMQGQVGAMAGAAKGNKEEVKLSDAQMEELAVRIKDDNKILLTNVVMELDELKLYLHRRRPNNPYGIMLGNLASVWRHLNMLMLGMCPNIEEIDIKGFLQYVTHEIRPEWCVSRSNTALVNIRSKSHVSTNGVIKFEGKPYKLFIDGGMPRPEIGVALNNPFVPMGIEERRIVDFLRSHGGFADLNEICQVTGGEINETQERLIAMHGTYRVGRDPAERASAPVQCKTLYNLYNSKDFKNLDPRMEG